MSSKPDYDIIQLPLLTIAHRCRQESTRFIQSEEHDPQYCFELFRRAIVLGDEHAWETIYTQYTQNTPIVRQWVGRHSSFSSASEEMDYFVNRAFEKMWVALDAEKFRNFSNLASLLRYLKLCTHSVITDHVRALQAPDLPLQETDTTPNDQPGIDKLQRQELWQMLEKRLNSRQERVALYCRFDVGMKPGHIHAAYPDLFSDVKEVYRVLQNILSRLRRDEALRAFHEKDA